MEIVVENVSDLTCKLTVTLPKEDVGKELDTAYGKLKKDVKIKGFRRGKIPKTILEKNYKPKVEAEVGEKLVQATYFDAVEEKKITPVVHPEIKEHNFHDNGTFSYVAEVDIKPSFELEQYKGLKIEKPPVEVTDTEIEEEINRLRKEMAPLKSAGDKTIEKNDIAIIDFQGFHNDQAMKEVQGQDFSVDIGSGRLGEEFEEKLIGLKKDEKTLHDITFPPEYGNPVLAGKTVAFKIDVKDIKERIIPELDDDFAQDVSEEYKTVDELKAGISNELLSEKESTLEGDLNDLIVKQLLENHDFAVPKRLVQYEINEMVNQTEENLKRSGLTLESAGLNRQELEDKGREAAEKRVRGDFILKEIAEKEEIKVADEDIERGYQRIAGQYNMTIAEVKQYFQRREEILPFMNELLNEKILNFLRENAEYIAPTEKETEEADNDSEQHEEAEEKTSEPEEGQA